MGKFLTLPLKPHIYHLRSRTVLETPLMSEQDVRFDPWCLHFSNIRSLIWLTLTNHLLFLLKGSWILASFLHIKDQKMSKSTLAELNELWMSIHIDFKESDPWCFCLIRFWSHTLYVSVHINPQYSVELASFYTSEMKWHQHSNGYLSDPTKMSILTKKRLIMLLSLRLKLTWNIVEYPTTLYRIKMAYEQHLTVWPIYSRSPVNLGQLFAFHSAIISWMGYECQFMLSLFPDSQVFGVLDHSILSNCLPCYLNVLALFLHLRSRDEKTAIAIAQIQPKMPNFVYLFV